MKLRLDVVLACFIGLICIQHIHCADEISDLNKWTCTCYANKLNHQTAIPTNCSSSCDCTFEGTSQNRWKCICSGDRLPEVAAGHESNCFVSCNCNSGFLGESESSKKPFSSKAHNFPKQLPLSSCDKYTSYNSSTKLISYKTASIPESKISVHSPTNPVTGCINKTSFFFRKQTRTVQGTITNFPYFELETATDKFSDSNLIGVGVSSHVYYGQLRDGRLVAVKRLKAHGGPDAEVTFLTEIELLSRLHHCHVVPLIGYCLEYHGKQPQMLLVFEYMLNGNLRECLDGASEKCLDWGARIAITDLGMAKSLASDGLPSCSSSPARMQGTFGYFAPEYAIVGRASLMSDVFSFGVVLLELISGRHPIYKSTDKGGEESLVIWATPLLHDSKRVSKELPDPRLKGKFEEEELQVMAYLAKECLLLDPDARPTMSEVVQILLTIAPEKSKRRNFSFDRYQDYTIRMDRELQQSEQTSSSGSFSSESLHTHDKEATTDSPEQVIFPPHIEDDDDGTPVDVDLTEPWLESFCVSKTQ
ncbi:hypothetical protein M8C21_009035 [Ambrosia artemisiifolia]|uniref:Protein kinase domain-containing protein n=1 Tax=Ambrosia artemisiifolia TaxID=4212 RepID=A0AAD5CAF4_AMBAR|nr:hypothetical protein M8C21_009035 [Ambrosia artemisiifolia]